MRIILADDDAASLDVLRRTLAAEGHDVAAFDNGLSAFDAFAAAPASVGLVIADIDMPGLDGISLAHRLLTARPDLPLILMSAHDGELQRAVRDLGSDIGRILKPFGLDALRAMVRARV
ncbi:MAG: response regulator [Hyphomicrobiaceae bacterium]|nr:response regulator [Hyphomicrobiaceae bacterium]